MLQIIYKLIGFGLNIGSLIAPNRAAHTAINLFSAPPKPRLREKERLFLDSARQVRRLVAGMPVVEYHWGEENAPMVLLSYGWGYNSGRWRHFVPELVQAGYRVVAYDPPGHGLAPAGYLNIPKNAAIIRALLTEYGPVEAIIGHSFGGSSSIFALDGLPAWQHPRRMVIMASFSYAPRIFDEYRSAVGLWPSLYWNMVRKFEQQIGYPLEYFDLAMMTAKLPHIQGLLVHSSGDRVTPYAEAQRYHAFWPGSRLFSPRDGGHHLGTPDITAAVLGFVLEGTAPAQAAVQEQPLPVGHDLVRYFAGM